MKTFLTVVLCFSIGGTLQARHRLPLFPAPTPRTPQSQHVYVSNSLNNTVTVIDAATNLMTATIPVGVGPIDLAADSDSTVYVLNGDNTVSVVNTETDAVSSTISLAIPFVYQIYPSAIAMNPNQSAVYVGEDRAADGLLDINAATKSMSIMAGTRVTSMTVSPDGSAVYAWLNAELLESVSTATGKGTALLNAPANSSPAGMAVSPNGATLYLAYSGTNSISVIDIATKEITSAIPVGIQPSSIAVSHDGGTLYVTNSVSNTVSVVNSATHSVTRAILVGKFPLGIAVSESGSIYVVNSSDNSMSVIDPATDLVTAVVSVGSGATKVVVQ